MAEIWPRLKRKLACDVRRRKKSSKSKNAPGPRASLGLEKLAALLKGVQSKKASLLVERTGASVSAARSLSRSAQEWTASMLARTASRREGSKSPEIVVLHCAVRPSDAQTRSFADRGFNPSVVEVESEDLCEPVVGSLERDLGNLSEDRQSQGDREGASPSSVALPVKKTGRCMKKIRSLQRTLNSAFVVFVALGAYKSSCVSKVGNQLAAILTFNAVVRVWRRGKLYASFMFSSAMLYFLAPLRSYLTYCPRRLNLGLPRKVKVIADEQTRLSTSEVSRNLETEGGQGSSLEISVLPLEPAPSAASGAPLTLLLTIPESSADPAETPATEPVPAAGLSFKDSGASSPPRRLPKKLSSRFKKMNMFRSSSSSSVSLLKSTSLSSPSHSGANFTEPGSPVSPSLRSSAASSPDRHGQKCPFSRRLHKSKSDIPLEFAEAHGNDATDEKKPSGKKSRLCRMSSTETLDIGEITASASNTTPTADASSWQVSRPMLGLLVTLLFLLIGRVPAIMATSLFLVVVSNAHHDRAHPRSRRRETRASEAARKLHRSPPPHRHPGSPPRRH